MRSALDSVPRSGSVPLVHHDRSSVRRRSRPRTASPLHATTSFGTFAASILLLVLSASGVGAQARVPLRSDSVVADALARGAVRQDTTSIRFPIAGLRLKVDSLVLRKPSIFGPFGAAAPYRPDPARVAAEEVRRATARRERLVARRWATLV
ncbi:MAG: hypothetical protein ABIW79_01170, partial [Gemmatimonas sp.]